RSQNGRRKAVRRPAGSKGAKTRFPSVTTQRLPTVTKRCYTGGHTGHTGPKRNQHTDGTTSKPHDGAIQRREGLLCDDGAGAGELGGEGHVLDRSKTEMTDRRPDRDGVFRRSVSLPGDHRLLVGRQVRHPHLPLPRAGEVLSILYAD